MNKIFLKRAIISVAIVVILCLVFVATSCAPSVPKEDYDKTVAELTTAEAKLTTAEAELTTAEAELATAKANLEKMEEVKEQLDGASSAWSSLEPKVKLLSILIENWETWSLHRLGEITLDERRVQTGDQWGRITVILKAIGDDELTENMKGGWFAESGTTKKDEHWSKATRLLLNLTEEDMESLSRKLVP